MSKRWKYLMVIAGVGLAWVIVAFATREREPEYGGKKLSEWVEMLATSHPDAGAVESVKDALGHFGTNAVPYLLAWLRYEVPPWKVKLYAATNAILVRLKTSWQLKADDNNEVRLARGATVALIQLRRPHCCIRELTKIVDAPGGKGSSARAAIVLGALEWSVRTTSPFMLSEFFAIPRDSLVPYRLALAESRRGGTNVMLVIPIEPKGTITDVLDMKTWY